MIKQIKTLTFSALFMALALTSFGQKFGYINSQELLVAHPDVKAADTQLKTFSDQLMAKGKKMVSSFEANYQKYAQDVEAGTLSKLQMQERERVLGEEQAAIQKFEVEMQQKVAAEREKVYSPILDKVKTTIEAIGAEEGYTMIFDTSTGSLVYTTPTEDLMNKVKTRLGIQ